MKKFIALLMSLLLCVSLFAACAQEDAGLAAAGDYLFSLYKDEAETTASDFDVVGQVMIEGVAYPVEWTVDTENVTIKDSDKAGFKTVDVNEKTEVEVSYTLTATVKNEDGQSVVKTFARKIPAYKVFSYAEYAAAEDDSTVVVKGIVIGIISKSAGSSSNSLYLQDENNEGGYYVYNLAEEPADLGIKHGMTVEITGVKDTYNGTYEIINASVEILDSNIKEVAPVDYTEAFANAEALTDAALVERQSMLVTVKGVEITGQDAASGYYKFKLGGKETYVRISSSNNCITKDEQTAFINGHTEHFGWVADITGIVSVYSGSFYLIPADTNVITYLNEIEKTPAEKVAIEKANIDLVSVISKDTVITLPTVGSNYDDVTVTWTSDNEAAVVAEGTLTVTMPKKDTLVKLTATIACGDVSETVEFEVKLQVRELTYAEVVDAVYALGEGEALEGTYRIYGVITSIDTEYSEQYGNITVTIAVAGREDTPIQCFRLSGEGAAELAVGDAITVEGNFSDYKGSKQLNKGTLIGKGEILNMAKTVADAYALAEGEAMTAPTVLSGVITTIDTPYSEQYGNVTVTILVDGTEQTIMCYRLKGEGAATLAVGDAITVMGTIKNYKGTVEFDAGCLLVPNGSAVQVRDLLALYALAGGEKVVGTKTLTGVITSIDTPYSEQYGNITVTMTVAGLADYPVSCYRLQGEGAAELAVGDTVTVSGDLTHYVSKDGVSSYQFNAKCVIVSVEKAAQ